MASTVSPAGRAEATLASRGQGRLGAALEHGFQARDAEIALAGGWASWLPADQRTSGDAVLPTCGLSAALARRGSAGSLPGVAAGSEIALVLHPRRDPGPVLDAIGAWATLHGSRLLMRAEDATRWDGDVTVLSDAELAKRADAVVSLGGDGTMLGALRLVARRPVPVLGVNLGNLGFLVEIQPEELPDALDRLERQDFTIEQHSGLWFGADGDEAVAFNDLALVRVPGDGVVEATLAIGGQRMGRYRCDGLVISTSIGSTAYAYSAGGPVVSPALDAVVVAALAPLAGISRPMVTAADEPIRLMLQESSGCPAIEVDGRMLRRTEPGEALDVRLVSGCGQVVRLDSDRYQRRNQVKLSLLDLPFLPDELRELAPAGSLPGKPRPPRALER